MVFIDYVCLLFYLSYIFNLFIYLFLLLGNLFLSRKYVDKIKVNYMFVYKRIGFIEIEFILFSVD